MIKITNIVSPHREGINDDGQVVALPDMDVISPGDFPRVPLSGWPTKRSPTHQGDNLILTAIVLAVIAMMLAVTSIAMDVAASMHRIG